ncbi:hypothetical protein WJX72_006127 [[Myrmecia] bisecta]|uniref:SHSP domain-containing protein n=1 Tax=[Myrmecia] bisecta TaxID=41462 RepID=A0AAW1QS34_9CHLO
MPNYIYLTQGHSNKLVGLAEGIQGTCNALSAIPAGRLADKTRRDTLLRFFGAVGIVSIVTLAAAVLVPNHTLHLGSLALNSSYVLLCCGLALAGSTNGGASVSDALFADSIATGARSKYFTALFASVLAAASVGPLLGALLFTLHGNRWDVHTLQIIILWGIGLALLPIGCMFFFNDDKSLGAESEAHLHEPLLGASPAAEADAEAGEAAPLHPDSAPVSGDKQAAAEPSAVPPRGTQRLSSAWIPYILASSDFVAGIASGMTIKFFPIFFLEAVQLPPIQVSVIMAATPLAIALMSAAVQPLSHTLGRAQTCLLTRLVAVVLLFYMGLVPTIWTRLAIIIPVFVVRGATSNCSYGLRKSILMDFVPKTKRATWNSLESVMVFGWSGSAFVGGLLVDSCGFDITFIITAVLQLELMSAWEKAASSSNFGRPDAWEQAINSMGLPLDMITTKTDYTVIADVPGLDREDIKVRVNQERQLTISGERKRPEPAKPTEGGSEDEDAADKRRQRFERRFGRFSRTFTLPRDADVKSISASVERGVLTLTVKRLEKDPDVTDIPIF